MRICLDGYNLALPQGTGVATYAFGLAKTLLDMGHQVDGLFGLAASKSVSTREVLFFEQFGAGQTPRKWRTVRHAIGTVASAGKNVRLREIAVTDQIERRPFETRLPQFGTIWSAARLFQAAQIHFATYGRFLTIRLPKTPDVMHFTYPLPLRVAGARNIYTLHDLVPLRLPYATRDDKRYYHNLVRTCVEQSAHICTVSEASKADILDWFPQAQGKVTNTYQITPVPKDVLAISAEENACIVERMFGLQHRGYFLFYGALDPKKNLPRIIEAHLTAGVDTPLVMVVARDLGEDARKVKGVGGLLFGQKLDRRIVQLEYLPRTTLLRLVQGAKAVVFPSLYEGFGLPVLEALQLGTPVISSTTSSLPEVAGEAGLLVDPYRVEEIAGAIARIDRDAGLWNRLAAATGPAAAKFSVAAYEQRLGAMYADILAGECRP